MPFERERQRVEAAIQQGAYAFRMEQVVHVHITKLTAVRRTFEVALQPIAEYMRLFNNQSAIYSRILYTFPPAVFPGVLSTFATVFARLFEYMKQQFTRARGMGLDVALSEATAVLDRLGNYCFTGDPRVLPSHVLRPLGTTASLDTSGWPYIDETMLSIRRLGGFIDIERWPRDEQDKPRLLHLQALAFYYGKVVSAERLGRIWFRLIRPHRLVHRDFLQSIVNKLFQDRFIPETVEWVARQPDRSGVRPTSGKGRRLRAVQRGSQSSSCSGPYLHGSNCRPLSQHSMSFPSLPSLAPAIRSIRTANHATTIPLGSSVCCSRAAVRRLPRSALTVSRPSRNLARS